MFQELINAIKAGYDAQPLNVNGNVYTTKPVHLPPADPDVTPLEVTTLTGLVDYITENIDQISADLHIRIVGPTQVVVEDSVSGVHNQRQTYLIADCSHTLGRGFPYGEFIKTDQAVIKLLSQFTPAGDRDALVSQVGTLLAESTLEVQDDGVSQQTTQRSGIRRREDAETKNPVILSPYRTFSEIEQPTSQFIYRLERGGRDETIRFALFESGDAQWRLRAIHDIKVTLQTLLDNSEFNDLPILA